MGTVSKVDVVDVGRCVNPSGRSKGRPKLSRSPHFRGVSVYSTARSVSTRKDRSQ